MIDKKFSDNYGKTVKRIKKKELMMMKDEMKGIKDIENIEKMVKSIIVWKNIKMKINYH